MIYSLLKSKIIACVIIGGALLATCNTPGDKSATTEHNDHHNHQMDYACPMHPDVMGAQGDKCSKCGMDLVAVKESSQDVQVDVKTNPAGIKAGEPVQLQLSFKQDNRNVALEISHEMKVHLMVISDDLSWFRHIHPLEQADGSYVVSETFPSAGKYLLFIDYKPGGAEGRVTKQQLNVEGVAGNSKADDTEKFVSNVDGYKVTLENGNEFKTGQSLPIEVSVNEGNTKLSGKDIEQYLGASAHIVMIGRSDQQYLHIHPSTNNDYPIYAETHIEHPGIYRMWVQFQVKGKVHVADFTINIEQGESAGGMEHGHDHQH